MRIRLSIATQPMFGGGIRGLGYFSCLRLPMYEVKSVLDWLSEQDRRNAKMFERGRR